MCTLKCKHTTEVELVVCFRRCGNLTSSSGLYIQRSGLEGSSADERELVAEVDAQHKSEAVICGDQI